MLKSKWPIILLLVFLFLPHISWCQSSPAKTLKTIAIQVASVKDLEKAKQELARLKSHGLNPFMRHERVKNKGMWYRIYVGKLETRDDATKLAQSIKGQGIISGFWVKTIEIPANFSTSPQTTAGLTEKPKTEASAGPGKQAPPPVVIKKPEPVVPTEEKPSPIQPPAEKPTDQKPSLSQPPIKNPEIIIPKKAVETADTDEKKIKEILPTDDIQEKGSISPTQGIAAQSPGKQTGSSRFSLGVKSSYFVASKTDNFKIEDTTGSDQRTWSFKNPKVYSSLFSSYRFNPTLSIEAGIERAFFTKLDIWHLNMGPKFEFRKIGMFTPYAKGSLVIGHLDWDDAPGDFDTTWGWEGGFGVFFTKSNMQIGLETSYRAIKYNYNRPSGDEVTATDSQLDFSGFALSGTLSYRF